jgi:hypothetical protein
MKRSFTTTLASFVVVVIAGSRRYEITSAGADIPAGCNARAAPASDPHGGGDCPAGDPVPDHSANVSASATETSTRAN